MMETSNRRISSFSDNESSSSNRSDEEGRHAEDDIATPDTVLDFLRDVEKAVIDKNLPELIGLYESQLGKLTDRYYKSTKWPSVEYVIDKGVITDQKVGCLYKEIYFRHLLQKIGNQTVPERLNSWINFNDIIDFIFADLKDPEEPGDIFLSPQWAWDLLDEYVYNYQNFTQFRSRTLQNKDTPDAANLEKLVPSVWDGGIVEQNLYGLVRASNVSLYLDEARGVRVGAGPMPTECARMIGYSAAIQLLRLHTLHGNYEKGMQAVDKLDLTSSRPLFCRVPGCHISLFYHLGFCYIMLRRYYDAIQMFSHILLFLTKSRAQVQYQDRTQDKICHLLLICVTLCPTTLDEQINKIIGDKYADTHAKLQHALAQRDDEKLVIFEEKFTYACPKFIPDIEAQIDGRVSENHQRQSQLFLEEVRQMKMVPTITSYLKLYTAISIEKLAKLCRTDEHTLENQIRQVKNKTRQLVHPPESTEGPLYGVEKLCGDIEFDFCDGKILVKPIKEEAPCSQVFLKNIAQLQDILRTIDAELN